MMTGEHQKVLSVRAINGRCPSMSNIGIITPSCLLIDFEEKLDDKRCIPPARTISDFKPIYILSLHACERVSRCYD